jgi:hypothetical protein
VTATALIRRVTRELESPSDVLLGLKSCVWALVLPVAKHLIPVKNLALTMRKAPRHAVRDRAREERIVTFARWAARLTRWRSGGNCLERGLIAYRYLCEAGAAPMLVVGVGRGDRGVIGHAWVLIDGRPAGESPSALAIYTPVFAFAANGELVAGLPSSATADLSSR